MLIRHQEYPNQSLTIQYQHTIPPKTKQLQTNKQIYKKNKKLQHMLKTLLQVKSLQYNYLLNLFKNFHKNII
jgi:ADP-heptose:LPS heptosyltransferase